MCIDGCLVGGYIMMVIFVFKDIFFVGVFFYGVWIEFSEWKFVSVNIIVFDIVFD